MPKTNIHERLEDLQQQIDELEVGHSQKANLMGLLEDIELELSTGSRVDAEQAGLLGRLENMVSEFETEHPTIAGILNDVMVKLASIGV
ncbi:MAG: hypothetical protein ACI89D_000817 [Bermanella sp.]|jgi:hypothetical protein